MRNLSSTGLVVLLAGSLITRSKGRSTNLSDSVAAAVLQAEWKNYKRVFQLGPLQFGKSYGPGLTMANEYPVYRALVRKGLLTLENEQDLTSGFSGWNNFLAQTQYGVQRTATVGLTPAGAKLGTLERSDPKSPGLVWFVFGETESRKSSRMTRWT